MFTPPPSPLPARRNGETPTSEISMEPTHEDLADHSALLINHISCPQEMKRRNGRRIKWAVFLVPLAMILITASTRYLSHPAVFDIFSSPPADVSWENLASEGIDWRVHRRHPEPQAKGSPTSTSMSSGASPSSSMAPSPDQPLPTIPKTAPPLPTPFPQPFDSDIQQNFSSMSCFNFFSNMTNSASFRSCRPLSCLLQSSSTFINAQQNLTQLNAIVWGTCNTTTPTSQCVSNMNSYASALKTSCVQDLVDNNAMATQTLVALQAYSVTHDGGCLSDPTTNSYCYVSAVRNSNPSDLYFYQLPLGIKLPSSSTPSCSPCTRSLMQVYAAALKTSSDSLTGLKKTYGSAAQLAVQKCGDGYADTSVISGNSAKRGRKAAFLILGLLSFVTWVGT